VHAYSVGPVEDCFERSRVQAGVDVFRELGRLPVAAAAQLIVNDGIDILIDLSGFTRHARPEILAMRPAPLQLSYLGFVATQGADYIDYTLLDRNCLLPAARVFWDEKIAYLPECSYHCERPHITLPMPAREDMGLPPSGLVLGALHHPRKLEPLTWQCWMSLLKALPDTCLWLLYETEEQRAQLQRNAAEYGVDATRLVFAEQVDAEQHLSRLRLADIFLDTFVYNGHTTTIDALGAGVPVVTLSGESVVARIAGSMLKAHGLPELVAESVAEYSALVHRLVKDDGWRVALTRHAREQEGSNLFCPQRRVREIETAYAMMWARHQSGLPPDDFDVPEFRPG
jgi:predicted O-linked N-acetylglucosamine transferase (SPINDLY family)